MMWRDDDVVELFGMSPDVGKWLDQVQDPQTGEFRDMVPPGGEESDRKFMRLLEMAEGGEMGPRPPMVMAILDSGMLHSHPAISGRIVGEIDFTGEGLDDLSGHGTMVTLAAIRGMHAALLNVKVAGADERGVPANLVEGLDWVVEYKRNNPKHTVLVNLSAGVHRRRVLDLLPCDGTCDVCSAAVRAAQAGILLSVAPGNTKGKVACPATVGLLRPELSIGVTTLLVDGELVAPGQFVVDEESLAQSVSTSGSYEGISWLSGSAADRHKFELGRQLAADGDTVQAIKIYRHLVKYTTSLYWQGRGAGALGELLASSGDLSEARAYLMKAVKGGVSDRDTYVKALFELGRVEYRMGNTDDATNWLTQAVDVGHEHYSSHASDLLGYIYMREGVFDRAIPCLDAAIRSSNEQARLSALYSRGVIAQSLGDRESAYDDFAGAVVVESPMRHAAALKLAALLLEDRLHEEALPWLTLASKADDPQICASAELALGDLAVALGGVELAKKYYASAVDRGVEGISDRAEVKLNLLEC